MVGQYFEFCGDLRAGGGYGREADLDTEADNPGLMKFI